MPLFELHNTRAILIQKKRMTTITISKLSKIYRHGEKAVLNSIDIDIAAGELFFLLGPSGCGKSTLLRIIAGLIQPSEGKIIFGNEDVTKLPTEKRNTAMVFQNYALWPHMTVLQNIEFGLSLRNNNADEVKKLSLEALEMTGMKDFSSRKPAELSGGQQQRVALARAIAVRPKVLLLDEPLSNLDAKLRIAMRREIRRICKDSGLTTIYVTHDQKEALAMADRMAVLHNGKLCQIGSPQEIYRRPNSVFVAGFIGEGNFIPAKIANTDGKLLSVSSAVGNFFATPSPSANFAKGDSCMLMIRPESILISDTKKENNSFPAKIANAIFLGEFTQWTFNAGEIQITVFEQNAPSRQKEKEYFLYSDPANIIALPHG